MNELLDIIRDVTGRDPEVIYEDFRPGELHKTWCDISKARESFGFNPSTPLPEGMARTWDWFLARRGR